MMLYPNDFKHLVDANGNQKSKIFQVNHKPISFNSWSNRGKFKQDSLSVINHQKITTSNDEPTSEDEESSWWHRYCVETSVHGIKYLVENDLRWLDRLVWLLIIVNALVGVGVTSFLLAERFNSSLLSTVVESTNHPVSSIPYPAITICNYNRISWKRAKDAQKTFLPNPTPEANETYWKLIEILNVLQFASFDEFDAHFILMDIKSLLHINLTEIYLQVMFQCDEIFEKSCWWRNKYLNCCSVMELQRSEYGLCYTFNSAVNPTGKKRMETEKNYPWRTSSYGDWSGLRIDVNTSATHSPNKIHGIHIMAHHPDAWAHSGYFIPTATQTSIILKPSFSYTTEAVERLLPEERQCIYEKEVSDKVWNLPELKYMRSNCISECRQRHTVKYCGCSIDLFFPIGNLTPCNVGNFKCLIDNNKILNYEKPPERNQYFDDDEEGMVCNCLPECNRIEYAVEISPHSTATKDLISIDVHYQYATIVKYRTDVTFGWLDLIVGFGGIAGLFLGCSIISMVELAYFVILWLLNSIFNIKRKLWPHINTKSNLINFNTASEFNTQKAQNHNFNISSKIMSIHNRHNINQLNKHI